ncbi:MAG: glycosyltransferase family 39 protein [Nitrospirae bacterium]|nr:glycosyltransferase family 39 protein [Nitrospirota bacterium]
MMTAQIEQRRDLLYGLLVAIVAFFVYADSLGNGFAMDDFSVILNNPVLRGSPLDLIFSIDTTSDIQPVPYYRPLTYLSFWIEGRLHGFNPFLVRLLNVLLHSANAFFVYRLARGLLQDGRAALFAGLLFAVHPLNSEGVNFNAGGRNTMLACFFVLTAYLSHRRGAVGKKFSWAVGGAVLFTAGLFSKEHAVAVLPFIIWLEYGILNEQPSGPRLGSAGRLLPYALGAGFYFITRWITLDTHGVQTGIIPGLGAKVLESLYLVPNIGERLLSNLYIIPKYFLTVLWPTRLSSVYEVPGDMHLLALPLAAAWLCIIGILIRLLTRGRTAATLFGLSWLIAFWLPVSGLVWFASSPLADRYLYLPAIGIWIIFADQFFRLLPAGKTARRNAEVASLIILLFLSALTIVRNLDWRNDIALFSRVVKEYPENPYGHAYLGDSYFVRGRAEDLVLAEQEFKKALDLQPIVYTNDRPIPPMYSLMVNNKMGHILISRGDYEGALRYYSEALTIYPLDKEALLNRGKTFEYLGRYDEAVSDYRLFLSAPGREFDESRSYAEERVRELSR